MSDVRKDFGKQFDRCFLCGTKAANAWPPLLQTHEVARGPNREVAKDLRSCLIRTCGRCHETHLDGMPIPAQLAIKKIFDPEGYNRVEVNRLRGSAQILMGRNIDNAISEEDVQAEVANLKTMIASTGTGFPYKRWSH